MSNREVVSDVFSMLLEDKKNALNVYNGLNDKTYDDPELVEVCTLEKGVSLSIRNDASFIVAMDLNMYEHQSTYNPNMPLRNLIYLTDIIKPRLKGKNLYGSKLIRIPTPKFVTFYNGVNKRPSREIFFLSHAYENRQEDPDLELKVTCYNINIGYNESILEKSSTLRDYMAFVNKVREFKHTDDPVDSVREAIDYCIGHDILKDFLLARRDEVQKAMVLDMTFEAREKMIKQDSYDDGFNDGFNDGFSDGAKSRQEEVNALQETITEQKSALAEKDSVLIQMQEEIKQLKALMQKPNANA